MEQNTTASGGSSSSNSTTGSDFASSEARARSSALASSSSSFVEQIRFQRGERNEEQQGDDGNDDDRNASRYESSSIEENAPSENAARFNRFRRLRRRIRGNFVLPFGYHQNAFASRSRRRRRRRRRRRQRESLQRRVQRIIEEHRRVRASHGLVFPRVRTYEAIFRANVTAGAKLRGDVRRRRDRVFGVEYRESADGSDQDESANWE